MKKKGIILSIFLSILSYANVRTFKPDFEYIEKYKKQKQAAAYLQEFNYITPSYNYNEFSNSIGLKWGVLSYKHDFREKSDTFSISKDLKEIFDLEFLVNYHKKLKEFYDLKALKQNEYKQVVEAYFKYILDLEEYNTEQEFFNNLKKQYDIAKEKLNLGKISSIDMEKIKLKLEEATLNLEKSSLELEASASELEAFNISKNDIDLKDIEIKLIDDWQIRKNVVLENEKIENEENLSKYTKLKNDIDVYMPNIDLSMSVKKEKTKNTNITFGVSISKTLPLADSLRVDNNLTKNSFKPIKKNYEEEIRKYNLLKKLYNLSTRQIELAKKELEIAKLKYDLGQISMISLIEKQESLKKENINLVVSKINLVKYVLERE